VWIRKHLASDWLAATWFFLYATAMWAVASFVLLVIDYIQDNSEEIYVWSSRYIKYSMRPYLITYQSNLISRTLSLSISVRSLGHNESVIDSALFLIGSVYFVAGKLLLKSGISVGRSPSSGFESLI